MDDSEYLALRTNISHIVDEGLNKFLERHSDDDKHLYELVQHIEHTKANDYTWDMEKIKIVLSVLQLNNPSDAQEILSYLNQSGYGWQGDTYQFYNRCLRFDQRCRRNCGVENDADVTSRVFLDMDEIFLHKEYGAVTTYLFGYCLAALFSSLLKTQHRGIPYVLQVACRRNSNTYRLVHEIVQICDVNAGIFDQCHEFHYAECDHDHATIYPKGTLENALDSLLYYRDIPVVVDGYENEKLYLALLRETANIPNRNKRLDRPSVKSCVSEIRQSQDWCSGNSAESGLKPFHTYGPGGGRYARRRRECRPKRRDNLSSGLSQWPGRRT